MPPSPDIQPEVGAYVEFAFPGTEDSTARATIVGVNEDHVFLSPPHQNAETVYVWRRGATDGPGPSGAYRPESTHDDSPIEEVEVQAIPLSQFGRLVEVYSAPGLE